MSPGEIPFHRPLLTGKERRYLEEALAGEHLAGDGPFSRRCQAWLEERVGGHALLTPSCTHALELAALVCELEPGDEVIMPSFTFVTTASAFVLRGATPVFVDIRPDTLNLDESLVADAITERTRTIVPVHYAGVGAAPDELAQLAASHGLRLVEDAAQGLGATWRGRPLGSFGDFSCFSFHETKNVGCGEGGALIVHDDTLFERAEIARNKGTDRARFLRGEVDKYSWVDLGSSPMLGELAAAFLLAQLEALDDVLAERRVSWDDYRRRLAPLADRGALELPTVPADCEHPAHIFWVKVADLEARAALLTHLRRNGIQGAFHFVPLHTSLAGRRYGRFHGPDRHTTRESERLVRLPLYAGLTPADRARVCECIERYYSA